MRPEDLNRVRHMIAAAETVGRFVEGRQSADLDMDQMLLFALVRAIEIIGEAASKVSLEVREANRQVPWFEIISMRNRLIHAYFDIDRVIVWKTAVEEIPALLEMLLALPVMDNGS